MFPKVLIVLIGCVSIITCQSFSVPSCNLTIQVGNKFQIFAAIAKGDAATYPVILAFEKTTFRSLVSYACLDYSCCTATRTVLIGPGGTTSYSNSTIDLIADVIHGTTTGDGRPFFAWSIYGFYCHNDQCTNGTLTSGLSVGSGSSIARQSNGNPILQNRYDIIWCSNPSCSVYIKKTLSYPTIVHTTSFAIDSYGNPWIATLNKVNETCSYIGMGILRCNDPLCNTYNWFPLTGMRSIDTGCNVWNVFSLSVTFNELGHFVVFAAHPGWGTYTRYRCLDVGCINYEVHNMSTVSPVRYTSVRSGVGARLWSRTNLSNGYTSIYKCASTDLDCDTRSSLYVYTSVSNPLCYPTAGHKYFEYGGRTLGLFTHCSLSASSSHMRLQTYDLTNANFGI